MTARLSDAALCAQIEADAMGRWDGFSVLDLVSRYRHAVMRAKLRAVVERHRWDIWRATAADRTSHRPGTAHHPG